MRPDIINPSEPSLPENSLPKNEDKSKNCIENTHETHNKINPFRPTHPTNEPPLLENELEIARETLIKKVEFPHINRRFTDPIKPGEPKFALFSYIETPDVKLHKLLETIKPQLSEIQQNELDRLRERKLIKGVCKIRGAYNTLNEANERAEEIVRDLDSTNSVFTCYMGVPFPLVSEGLSEETNSIDLQNEIEHAIAENVRRKRQKEQKEMEELKQRGEEIVNNAEVDPNEQNQHNYTTQRVKLANLQYELSKMDKIVKDKENTLNWLRDAKKKNPEFEENYMKIYLDGRKAVNIDESLIQGFMKYMKDPLE